ncbi:hypothetical protein [Devosia sp. 1566]|uniref:hypothetical protein n=1 Tax=Devosia sp. 1566 TaxID=2499144 RepID=UPI000FDAF556|nr:hypothetical protein [Devosia sp. 1566]
MPKPKAEMNTDNWLRQEWPLPSAATLGSFVRAKGIVLEIRARLPGPVKKSLDLEAGRLVLKLPPTAAAEFTAASTIVAKALEGIESLPVIPREIEDILTISTTERHRWLKDGRLPSAGTRTVKLAGRAKKITFHVFDPRKVEDILDRDMVVNWREEDAATRADNRRQAAWKAKVKRAQQSGTAAAPAQQISTDEARPQLIGWEEFERDGPLR